MELTVEELISYGKSQFEAGFSKGWNDSYASRFRKEKEKAEYSVRGPINSGRGPINVEDEEIFNPKPGQP